MSDGDRCRGRGQRYRRHDVVGREGRVAVGQVNHSQRLRVVLHDMVLRTDASKVRQLLIGHSAQHRQRRLARLQGRRRRGDLGDERLRHMVAGLLLLGLRGSGSRPAPVSVYLNDEAHLSFRRRFFLASVESDTNWCQRYKTFFPSLLMTRPNKLEQMSLKTLYSQVLEFEGKARANPIGASCFLGKLLVFPTNVRLDWKVIGTTDASLFGLINSDEGKMFFDIDTWYQGCKTFFLRHSHYGQISQIVFVPGMPLQPSLMFACKANNLL